MLTKQNKNEIGLLKLVYVNLNIYYKNQKIQFKLSLKTKKAYSDPDQNP